MNYRNILFILISLIILISSYAIFFYVNMNNVICLYNNNTEINKCFDSFKDYKTEIEKIKEKEFRDEYFKYYEFDYNLSSVSNSSV